MTITTSSKEKDAAKNEIASFSAKAAKLKHEGDAHFGKRNLREALHAAVAASVPAQGGGRKTRYHGDYHLGQVLVSGNDFVIIDNRGG